MDTSPGGIRVGEMKCLDVDGARVAVANVAGSLYGFSDTCTHRGCPLSEGTLSGTVITCPCHGSRFDIVSGDVVRGPARDPLDVYRVRIDGDELTAQPASAHSHGQRSGDGIEWEDGMPEFNRASNTSNTTWKCVDRRTGLENGAIRWAFTVGDRVKIRLVNEMKSDHPMHHPFHIHGAGRFLILARNGHPESNLVWKDTILVRIGETVDILLEITNPGVWMAHCHIAEHMESGMMFSFNVAPNLA
jgi:nitrite reductase/ring-hydroxylating ferredoxin subunit